MIEPKVGEKLCGKVKWFNEAKGFGFIIADDRDFFVHFRSIRGSATFKSLQDGQTVDFTVAKKDKGFSAENVSVIEANGNAL